MNKSFLLSFALLLGVSSFPACQSPESEALQGQDRLLPDTSRVDPVNPDLEPNNYSTAVLLFDGSGVSTSDWQTTETIIQSMGLSYERANTAQLNSMSLAKLSSFGVIVVPGGSGGTIYQSLSTTARLNVRKAVRDHGVGYVGFCAGAWVAVGPEADGNATASYGFAVAKGNVLPYWYPGGNTSSITAMVDVTFSNGSVRSLVWYGGPATPEWSGGVIARYSDGKPAISQKLSGKGLVVIAGTHPEAPQGWRASAGYDRDGLDYDIAIDMIEAAIQKRPMATY